MRPVRLSRLGRSLYSRTGGRLVVLMVLLAAWPLLQWRYRLPAACFALSVADQLGFGRRIPNRLEVELIPGPTDAKGFHDGDVSVRFRNTGCRRITILSPNEPFYHLSLSDGSGRGMGKLMYPCGNGGPWEFKRIQDYVVELEPGGTYECLVSFLNHVRPTEGEYRVWLRYDYNLTAGRGYGEQYPADLWVGTVTSPEVLLRLPQALSDPYGSF